VLDSTTHIVASGMSKDDIRELLYDLAVRFRSLGVTCLFTLESDSMYSMDFDVERGFSALADNVIMLRYARVNAAVVSSLMVVKTRGSRHETGLYAVSIGKGGLRLTAPLDVSRVAGQPPAKSLRAGRRH